MFERPLFNVALVSIIILAQGIIMLIFGIYIGLFLSQLNGYLAVIFSLLPFSNPESYILIFGSSYTLSLLINLNSLRLVFLIGWGIFSVIVFITFSNLKSWAYYLAMMQSIVGFILSALILTDLMGLPLIASSILVIIYLLVSEEIKRTFIVS
ncbi:MAG: hypothetical protein QW279_07990 [Candidatus Jordarchaeaceae archaeon]